jgi:hypothetical protein
MMLLEADRAATLDACAREFMATFIAHAVAIAGDDQSSLALIGRTKVLLIVALAGGDAAASAWSMLHRTITTMVEQKRAARQTPVADAYLQSFLTENGDLDHD